MITVKQEHFSVVEANKEIIADHWNEVAAAKGDRELDVDWETFRAIDEAGNLVTIVARDSGAVVGYAVFLIQPHLHAKKTLAAFNDALFLHKSARKGRAGIMLISESRKILESLYGRIMIIWHVKPHVDFSPILLKQGYQKHETLYAIVTGD